MDSGRYRHPAPHHLRASNEQEAVWERKGTFLNPSADIFPLSEELGVVSGPSPPKVPGHKRFTKMKVYLRKLSYFRQWFYGKEEGRAIISF